jgi:hypothetical protein
MNAKTNQSPSLLSRREWLANTLQLSLTGTLYLMASGCQRRDMLVCSDSTRLTDAENSLRASLHYTEESPQSDKVCALCAFFERATGQGCGNCKLLRGPVNPRGHCDSWSAATK